MHLPSAEKLWHIPDFLQFPIPVPSPCLSTPLDVQATSYLAASLKICSLSYIDICSCIISAISVHPFSYTLFRSFLRIRPQGMNYGMPFGYTFFK